ncbi:uncharacterized protein [Penaeus vannamei]|uniref:uncharacterized protein n=1 Tax=Penaeus vannamei TaxID=6689 RepID=UPI00387F4C71
MEWRVMWLLLLLLLLLGSNISAFLLPISACRGCGQLDTGADGGGRIAPFPQSNVHLRAGEPLPVRTPRSVRDSLQLSTMIFKTSPFELQRHRSALHGKLSGGDSADGHMLPTVPAEVKESLIFRSARREHIPKPWFRRVRSCHTLPCSHNMDNTISLLMRMMEAGK